MSGGTAVAGEPARTPAAVASPVKSTVVSAKPPATAMPVTVSGASRALRGGAANGARKPAGPTAAAATTANKKTAPPPPPPRPKVMVKGLTGTLNTDDVHQTMEAQQPAFDRCIEQGRRAMRFVNGAMRFAFKVDAEGRILDVHPTESSIGHRALEQCLQSAVSTVVFPKPAGRADAQFGWRVTVDPAGTPADPLDAKAIEPLVRKRRRTIARECDLRPRERFRLTAYIGPNGRVLSAGGFAQPARAADKVDCVLEAVGDLRLPKVTRRSKVSFRF